MSSWKSWSTSAFAQWIRRAASLPPAPAFATFDEWREFEAQEKTQSPFLHWFLRTFLVRLQRLANWPRDRVETVCCYLHNRFVARTHLLRTGVKPGRWAGLPVLLLNANMNALVDFVEIQLAGQAVAMDQVKVTKRYVGAVRWWRPFRCPPAGLDYLSWETTLDRPGTERPMPQQAHRAREVLALYRWWTELRPQRLDPKDASGLSAICDAARQSGQDIFDPSWHPPEYEAAEEKRRQLGAKHEAEDEAMLLRLVKIRSELWL